MKMRSDNYKQSIIQVDNSFICEPFILNDKGNVVVKCLYFRNDHFKTNSSNTKLAYLFSDIYQYDKTKIKLISDVIYFTTQCNYFDYEEALDYNIIDVESMGVINDLFTEGYSKSFKKVRNFIFNKNCWLIGPLYSRKDKKISYSLNQYSDRKIFKNKIKII